MIWPAGAPCTKLYTGGKHCIKGPPPANHIMSMEDVFESNEGYQKWITQLAT